MTTIATIIVVIVAVIGVSFFLTQTGWFNQNTTDSLAPNGTNGAGLTQNTTDNGGVDATQEGTVLPTGNNQTAKQVLYRNVSAIIGMETKSIEMDLLQPLNDNTTHWITGTITLNHDLLDANDDKNLNIKIFGFYKFNHGNSWIPICEDWVGSSPFGEKMISNLQEPNEEQLSENLDDTDNLSCDFENSYTKIRVELNNERSSYEKTVTLDLFVLSRTVVTT